MHCHGSSQPEPLQGQGVSGVQNPLEPPLEEPALPPPEEPALPPLEEPALPSDELLPPPSPSPQAAETIIVGAMAIVNARRARASRLGFDNFGSRTIGHRRIPPAFVGSAHVAFLGHPAVATELRAGVTSCA